MKNRPTRVGDALQDYLKSAGLDERLEEAGVLPEWAARVGPAIAAVTEPLRTSTAGVLVVAVRSSAWLSELKLMEREIVARLNEGRKKGRIQHIRFVMADGA